MCPTDKSTYSFKKSKYFGAYKNKAVKFIYEIIGVVDVEKNSDLKNLQGKVFWKNDDIADNNSFLSVKEINRI